MFVIIVVVVVVVYLKSFILNNFIQCELYGPAPEMWTPLLLRTLGYVQNNNLCVNINRTSLSEMRPPLYHEIICPRLFRIKKFYCSKKRMRTISTQSKTKTIYLRSIDKETFPTRDSRPDPNVSLFRNSTVFYLV